MDFRIGDAVICVNNKTQEGRIEHGKVYKVVGFEQIGSSQTPLVSVNDESGFSYYPFRFVKLEGLSKLERLIFNV